MSDQVAEEYVSSLADLTVNSKPLINMLTMLAEENSAHAPAIVEAIERHIDKVSPDVKLPILYLIDSIIKNVASVYKPLFTEKIVGIFASVFEKVDEKTRLSMFKLRQTWNDIFPDKKLYALDCRAHYIDHNWPSLKPPSTICSPSIHLNPRFLSKSDAIPSVVKAVATASPEELQATVEKKKKILQELQKQRRELELLQQQFILGEQSVRVIKPDAAAKVIRNQIKSTPRAVVIPPANSVQAASPVKAKIAPVNSALLEAVKLRDPRLAKRQEAVNDAAAKFKKSSETDGNFIEDLIRQQQTQSLVSQQITRVAEDKVPEAKVAEEEIQLRQMAMLKAPVLGQLNRKGSDEKAKRRNSPPRSNRNHRDSLKSNDSKSKHKDDKSRKKSSRDKSSRYSSKSEENRHDRKRDKSDKSKERKAEPAFSPASSDSQSSPRPKKRLSPVPPPPPVINLSNTTEEPMDLDVSPPMAKKMSPQRDSVTFKNVKGAVKSRNYSRRNKERSVSPLDSPPRLVDLLSRIPAEVVDVGKDTDMRAVKRSPKKRLSVDGIEDEPPNKQKKSDESDVIGDLFRFGAQDKDERICIRTPPPPPLISITPPRNSPKPDDAKDAEKPRNDFNRRVLPVEDELHVEEMFAQAKDQLANGVITSNKYNEIVASIVRLNEGHKIKNAQKSFDGPRSKFPDSRPWRRDEENGSYDRRWRGGRNARGSKGRGRGSVWRENRFPSGRHSPEIVELDSRSQEAWLPKGGPNLAAIIPATDSSILDVIDKDTVKQISIDGMPRAIRYYGDVAVVMLSFSSVRQIHFQNGSRRVFIGQFEVTCKLNGPAEPFVFQNQTYMVRLGAPTRELYIDDRFYELHFGDQRLSVEFGGVPLTVQLEGPPPEVRFKTRGLRYCLGCVMLIVDARISFTLYLDAKPQRFEINGRPLILRFKDKFNTILINEVPVGLQFGGNPVPIYFNDQQHFLRLTELPPMVTPGEVSVNGMDPTEDNPILLDTNSMDVPAVENGTGADTNRGMYLDLVSSTMGKAASGEQDQSLYNYQLCSDNANPATPAPAPAAPMPLLKNLDLNNLFQTLVASGIIPKQEQIDATPSFDIRPVDFKDPKSLKEANPGAVMMLYSGMQCASCGVRFPVTETAKYSQHLDWHFRQNRRDRDAARRGASRRWYYDIPDWMQYEEVEDLEERAQNWFETEGQGDETREDGEVPSVPAPPHTEVVHCLVCHDQFDSFFHEDTEEWHLKNCVAFNGNYYHPVCYEDSMKKPEAISAPPLLAPLEEEKPVKVEEPVVVLDIDDEKDDDDDLDDVEIVTTDYEAIEELVENMMDRIEMEEECERSPIEDDELEVLAVTNKDENKPPIEVIEVPDDGEIFFAPTPVEFDPDITIKQEPMEEMEAPVSQVDQTTTTITASIDGNVEMAEAPTAPAPTASKIKITFSKSQPVITEAAVNTLIDTVVDPNELQIEEIEPEPLPLKPKKPRIAERELTVFPAVTKGKEVSGLCSIM